ncbi:F-box protein [Nymphaea thermarum]|nr:F-box protein [Nymphaea thermarum]
MQRRRGPVDNGHHHHQRTWPPGSDGTQRPRPFASLPMSSHASKSGVAVARTGKKRSYWFGDENGGRREPAADFSSLPFDVLRKIAAAFSVTNLWAASGVCRAWREGLQPLREAVVLVRWGKRFKHGTGGVRRNVPKALETFLKAASRGCAAAMVDAGLIYWEMGKKDEGIALFQEAALLGDPAGQCNLGLSCLQAESPNLKEAVKLFYEAASKGNTRAQYSLALCLQQGRGVERDLPKAARWYLKAALGGNPRAMYNASLCYSSGEGMPRSYQQARIWMKRAAESGHSKAQFEHGLNLFSEGKKLMSLLYFELALRSGEQNAAPIKEALLQQLPPASRDEVMSLADNWHPVVRPLH